MNWLFRPKVLLGLFVNAAYLLFCLAAPARHEQRRPYRPASQRRATAPALLAPPSAPSKATTYYAKQSDQLNVYLTNDLTLIRRPGHTLLLSPTFSVRGQGGWQPATILLRFVAFSGGEQYYDDQSTLTIFADGVEMWPDRPGRLSRLSSGPAVPHSVTTQADGTVAETFGEEIPYEDFLDIISARQVIIGLDADRVELTADQIEALRDMHRRLPQPPPLFKPVER